MWDDQKSKKRAKRRARKRNYLKKILGNKCKKCGSKKQLEFDHLNPTKKKFKISKFIDLDINNLIDEVNQCQLLCKKCHHKKTLSTNEYSFSRHGTITKYKRDKCRCSKCKAAYEYYQKKTKKL
jgi:5-methylcytosine-specific restriction endonuclease McrA